MKLDELKVMWQEDAPIGPDLAAESLNIFVLHSKWLGFLTDYKMYHKAAEVKLYEVGRKKVRYYKGEMNQEELDANGWKQYQGARPLKAELDDLLQSDPDVMKVQMKVDHYKMCIDFCTEVMKAIGQKNWNIKNAIEWNKFQAGA